ncbi:ABC transporter substrate-binding protein [Oscillibacter sp.]|uniref:ABC transporter substrate-binding protein n=1 Tax=Oscillibacter sp. TaxID=1945593 RepID=UPI00260C8363|nr:ABC transporter substrate-binding protein [Oscillibacter sp.]MDD3347981.1 ABC transporter substrate-binding protein [Oscillibacter sp.]
MELKGITWDHARGYDPLLVVSEAFQKEHPDVQVSWKKRSLKDFGDYPVSRLAQDFDLIMIDHPFMAEALQEKLLVVLNEHLTPGYLQQLEGDEVGKSLESYCVNGAYQGLPVDAATQVAAANMEIFRRKGATPPETFAELMQLHERLGPGAIGVAMAPTDIFSTYFGLVAQLSGKDYFDMQRGIDPQKGALAAARLYQLKEISAPETFEMNPIHILDEMSNHEKFAYTPYVYGYTNYSREGFRPHLLEFWDAPLVDRDAAVSTQLGGVGIAISAAIAPEKLETAVRYAEFLASPAIQKGIYTAANGQPATWSAWMDEENNRLTHHFFKNTIRTIDTAFLRPKVARWNTFQEAAGEKLHQQVAENCSCEEIVQTLNGLYREICMES